MKNGPTEEMVKSWGKFGTGGDTGTNGMTGDTPVKNRSGAGNIDMGVRKTLQARDGHL